MGAEGRVRSHSPEWSSRDASAELPHEGWCNFRFVGLSVSSYVVHDTVGEKRSSERGDKQQQNRFKSDVAVFVASGGFCSGPPR